MKNSNTVNTNRSKYSYYSRFSAIVVSVGILLITGLINQLVARYAPNADSFGYSTAMFVVSTFYILANIFIYLVGLIVFWKLRNSSDHITKRRLFNTGVAVLAMLGIIFVLISAFFGYVPRGE